MKRVVLIDGENLTYGLRTLLSSAPGGTEAPRTALKNYDFRRLIDELLADYAPAEILWFGARLRRYVYDEQIRRKSEEAIALQADFVNQLQRQKVTFIKVGYLRARESETCKQCGYCKWGLLEKGVNVGLAVRMVTEAARDVELVIISSDTDLLPAIRASRKLGAKVMHVGYEHTPIAALSTNADATRIITRPLAKKYTGTIGGNNDKT